MNAICLNVLRTFQLSQTSDSYSKAVIIMGSAHCSDLFNLSFNHPSFLPTLLLSSPLPFLLFTFPSSFHSCYSFSLLLPLTILFLFLSLLLIVSHCSLSLFDLFMLDCFLSCILHVFWQGLKNGLEKGRVLLPSHSQQFFGFFTDFVVCASIHSLSYSFQFISFITFQI